MPRPILIVGGNSGIGLATVRLLRDQSREIVVAARSHCALDSLGINPLPFDAEAPTLSPDQLPEALGGLAYFPGTISLKPFHRLTHDDFRRDLEINLLGAVQAIQASLPALKRSDRASVVLFSTVAVAQGMPFHASIAAAKGAVEGLARSLAAELAPSIRVNLIAPSLTDTPLAASLLNSDTKREASTKRHPLQQVGDAEDIAQLVCHLLSDASKFITGQTFRPDGGLSSTRLFT